MNLNHTLENLRVSYQASRLDLEDCHSNPVTLFNVWLDQAIKSKCDEPNAFVLSTVKNNCPRSRVVLLKGIDENKFIFYSNYNSAKGQEASLNDRVAMNFLWLPLQRQIRIEGKISKVMDFMSDDYFHKRPRGSQIGAIASPQSSKVKDRSVLEKMFIDIENEYQGIEILPRPQHWGGYAISPDYIEFWQGRSNRMHDRICYEKIAENWNLYRVAP
jgi:pyridoxamine 5'-phosphate oxidase